MAKEEGLFTVEENISKDASVIFVSEEELEANDMLPNQQPKPPVPPAPMPAQPQPTAPQATPAPAGKEQAKPAAEDGWRNTKDPKHFTQFLYDEVKRIPKSHETRGNRSLMERALGQYKKLGDHISDALRRDYDGVLDVVNVDKAREMVEQHIESLEIMLEALDSLSKNKKKLRRRGEEVSAETLIKEANTPHFTGLQTQISAFERAVVGMMVNGTVSGGRDMEETYEKLNKKYKFTPREELAIFQILSDFGYPTFMDRYLVGEKNVDTTKSEEMGEWQAQYQG